MFGLDKKHRRVRKCRWLQNMVKVECWRSKNWKEHYGGQLRSVKYTKGARYTACSRSVINTQHPTWPTQCLFPDSIPALAGGAAQTTVHSAAMSSIVIQRKQALYWPLTARLSLYRVIQYCISYNMLYDHKQVNKYKCKRVSILIYTPLKTICVANFLDRPDRTDRKHVHLRRSCPQCTGRKEQAFCSDWQGLPNYAMWFRQAHSRRRALICLGNWITVKYCKLITNAAS
jgi:hypothetical protein